MIQWCYEIWYDDNIIQLETCFTKSDISFSIDESKDNKLDFPDETK